MSYLDKNPFNRPTPSFGNNINTTNFNTYSNYSGRDYLEEYNKYSSSNQLAYQYGGNTNGKYFSSNQIQQPSTQYKYSRTIQDSPFISGGNPFSISTANINYNSNSKLSNNPHYYTNNTYQRESYESKKEYSYQPKISNVSGFTDPYQQDTYFKNYQFQDQFKKSLFQKDFQLQLGKSRQSQLDLKYQSSTNKQVTISKLLQNNPFQKPTLQPTQSTKNHYDPYRSATQPTSVYNKSSSINDNYEFENAKKYSQTKNSYNKTYQFPIGYQGNQDHSQNQLPFSQRNLGDKYQHLIYKSNPLAVSDVKKVQGFEKTNQIQLDPQIKKYLQQYQKYEKVSQNGSRNTFINKIQDLISDQNQQKQTTAKYEQKKKIQNPFLKADNPFAKPSLTSQQSQKQQISESLRKQQNLRISSKNSIKFEDFIDIESKKEQYDKQKVEGKSDKYGFQRDFQNSLFSSQTSSKKSYDQKVDEQFEKWGRESSKKSLNEFEQQRLERSVQNDKSSKKSNQLDDKVSRDSGVYKKPINILQSKPNQQQKDIRSNQKPGESRNFSKKSSVIFDAEQGINSLTGNSFKKRQENAKSQKNSKQVFRFERQVFEDEQDDNDGDSFVEQYPCRREEEGSLRRITEARYSDERESEPFKSKRQSRVSQMQVNTQEKIDQKLSKYKYEYQRPQASAQKNKQTQKQESIKPQLTQSHFPDFMDFNVSVHNQSYAEQQSFQSIHSYQNHNQLQPEPKMSANFNNSSIKRINLKERVLTNLKNDSSVQEMNQQQYISNNHVQNVQTNNSINEQNNKLQKENYEFQSLDQFEGKYHYDMKESGFDFQQDQFEENEKQLEFQYQDLGCNGQKGKVLSPKYGYDDEDNMVNLITGKKMQIAQKIPLEQKQVPVRRYISSISSNSEDTRNKKPSMEEQDDFLPTFKVKQQEVMKRSSEMQKGDRLSEVEIVKKLSQAESKHVIGVQAGMGKKFNTYTQQSKIQQRQQKSNQVITKSILQPKVQRVKIYDSQSQSEPYRSSGQYNQSPFQKRADKPQNKIRPYYMEESQVGAKRQSIRLFDEEKVSGDSFHSIDDVTEEDLKQTVKYQTKKERDYIRTPKSEKPNQQPPLRDSFDFSISSRKDTFNFMKNKTASKHPVMLEFKGNIYYLINFIQ